MEENKSISFISEGKSYTYTANDIKDISTDSIDNINITEEPMKYLYRMKVRQSLMPSFMVFVPQKFFVSLNKPIEYFS